MTSHDTASMPPVTGRREKFKQTVKENKVLVILLALVVVAGIVVAYFVIDAKSDKAPVGSITAPVKDEAKEITCEGELVDNVCKATTEELNLTDKQLKNLAESIDGVYRGFKQGQLDVGAGPIPKSPHERASQAFTKKTIETREELIEFFASDHDLAQAARERVVDGLEKAGWAKKDIEDALTNPGRWIFVAPNVDHAIFGTTFPTKSGKGIFKVEGARGVAANDAIWFPVGNDGRIVKEAAVRADCGNPEVDKITPVNPYNPPPPITCVRNCTPPPKEECPTGTVDSPTGCLKPAGQNDPGGSGGNGSPFKDPVKNHPQGPTGGTSGTPPKDDDPVRTPDDNGQSGAGSPGDGGAGPAEGPSDTTHSGDDTTHTDSPSCPFGPENC